MSALTSPSIPDSEESGGPDNPGALASDVERCQHWHDMDAYHSTPRHSPLHHDSRCVLHN